MVLIGKLLYTFLWAVFETNSQWWGLRAPDSELALLDCLYLPQQSEHLCRRRSVGMHVIDHRPYSRSACLARTGADSGSNRQCIARLGQTTIPVYWDFYRGWGG
ncbi:hypothetical protein HDV62DRAFT_72266 [Trichoderma sp. SZMC 28011]